MGELLLKYYKYISDEEGLQGKVKLAQMTKVPSVKAAMAPDDAANIENFRKAIAEITGKPAPEL